ATLQQAITQDSDQLSDAASNRVSISTDGDVNIGAPPDVSLPVAASHLNETPSTPQPEREPTAPGGIDAPLPKPITFEGRAVAWQIRCSVMVRIAIHESDR